MTDPILPKQNGLAFQRPVWSPDGKKLVYFVEGTDHKNRIGLMNIDGTGKKLLTAESVDSFSPSWSVDGKRILFTSVTNGKAHLYSMRTDGSDIRPLGIEASFGRWSPNGKKIVYIHGRVPDTGVFVADADGSNVKKLLP